MGNIRNRLSKVEKAYQQQYSGKFFLIYQNYSREEYVYDGKKFGRLDELYTSNNIDEHVSTVFILHWYRNCEEEKNCV